MEEVREVATLASKLDQDNLNFIKGMMYNMLNLDPWTDLSVLSAPAPPARTPEKIDEAALGRRAAMLNMLDV